MYKMWNGSRRKSQRILDRTRRPVLSVSDILRILCIRKLRLLHADNHLLFSCVPTDCFLHYFYNLLCYRIRLKSFCFYVITLNCISEHWPNWTISHDTLLKGDEHYAWSLGEWLKTKCYVLYTQRTMVKWQRIH